MVNFVESLTFHSVEKWHQLEDNAHYLKGMSHVSVRGLGYTIPVIWEIILRADLTQETPEVKYLDKIHFQRDSKYFSAEEFTVSSLGPYFSENWGTLLFNDKITEAEIKTDVDWEAFTVNEILSRDPEDRQ